MQAKKVIVKYVPLLANFVRLFSLYFEMCKKLSKMHITVLSTAPQPLPSYTLITLGSIEILLFNYTNVGSMTS